MIRGCLDDAWTTRLVRSKSNGQGAENVVMKGLSGMLGDQLVIKRDTAEPTTTASALTIEMTC